MKAVYLFSNTESEKIKKILKDDKFMRLSYIIKIGELFVTASDDEIKLLEEEFSKINIKRAEPEEELKIINRIENQEENSACGMGLIFG